MTPGRIFSWHDDVWFEYSFLKPRKLDAAVENAIRRIWTFERRYSVLDVGCGSGRFLTWLDELGHRAVGIEPSEELVLKASKRVSSRVRVEKGFAEDLPFEDSSFDYVFFVFALEFTRNPLKALAEGLRVAKKGVFIASLQKCSPLVFRECLRSGRWWVWEQGTGVTNPGGLGKIIGRLLQERGKNSRVAVRVEYLWPDRIWAENLKIVGRIFAPVVVASLMKAVPVEFRLPYPTSLSEIRPLVTPFPDKLPVIRWTNFLKTRSETILRRSQKHERVLTL